jgi:hypothetical protein
VNFWEFASGSPVVACVLGFFAMISICVSAIALSEAVKRKKAGK